MPTKPYPSAASKSDKPQLDKFKEAARELECDDDEQRFKKRLGRLLREKPKPK
jgi:hypothetical protein